MYDTVIEIMSPIPDGINTDFSVAKKFVSGTTKIIVNGQIYESTDEQYGYSENGDDGVKFVIPPLAGDVIQLFMQDSQTSTVSQPIGSPFDPNGILP